MIISHCYGYWPLTKSVRTKRERTNIEVFGAELWCGRGRITLFWCALTTQIKSVSLQYKNAETLTFKLAIAETIYLQSAARRHTGYVQNFTFCHCSCTGTPDRCNCFSGEQLRAAALFAANNNVCVARRQFFGNAQYTPIGQLLHYAPDVSSHAVCAAFVNCVFIHAFSTADQTIKPLPFMYPWSARREQ